MTPVVVAGPASWDTLVDVAGKAEVAAAVARAQVVVADLADHARAVLRLARDADRELWCDLHDWDGREAFCTRRVCGADGPSEGSRGSG